MLEWDRRFRELVEFKERFGHCNVPAHSERQRVLGHWVFNQRVLKRAGRLDRERRLKLEREGFMWDVPKAKRGVARGGTVVEGEEWQPRYKDQEWYERYWDLLEHRMMHGHCTVVKKEGVLGR
jgi:hypothetical protein